MARLKEFYVETVVKELTDQFKYKSIMEVPRIDKITLNMGVGEAVADKKVYGKCSRRYGKNCRSKANCYAFQEINCWF